LKTIVTLLLPPAFTFALALALRLFAKEKAERVGLLPVAVSVLVGWIFIVRPGWMPVDDLRRVVHIGVGAAVLGIVLDALRPHRFITVVLVAGFVLGCSFASVTGALTPSGPISARDALLTAALAVAAFFALARFDAVRERPSSLMILLTLVAFGLSVLGAIAHDEGLTGLALVLAVALTGYLFFVMVTGAPVGDGVILLSGASMLAIVWALAQRHPDMRLALLCLPLVLFAEATAQRVPLPAARISALLYPFVLAGLVSLPLALAALISFVTSGL
jgi:hypothetical protein